MKYLWKLQDAKSKFSKIVQDALKKGPQFITRHGKETAVLISIEEYRKLTGVNPEFRDFLLNIPKVKDGLPVTRDQTPNRKIDL
jgi:prevent-host-death family protein